eukprot:TRINITY_DN9450_c1_g1_i1.p3 TRINITY_DN9450_c1_g1~~TRINITY_DN9450_c1_g1_i1.p3  ORF type:complete len:125 (-),score=2.00 TRINITY_DN9450_c1_g1_i1:567-941(-)
MHINVVTNICDWFNEIYLNLSYLYKVFQSVKTVPLKKLVWVGYQTDVTVGRINGSYYVDVKYQLVSSRIQVGKQFQELLKQRSYLLCCVVCFFVLKKYILLYFNINFCELKQIFFDNFSILSHW